MKKFFLHGLDSSGNGTKGRFFKEHFPDMIVPDFGGSLELRLQKLEELCQGEDNLVLVGSSFGGLMATCFAAIYPQRVKKLLLMAPALNFPGFIIPREKIPAPTFLLIGDLDNVTPAASVIPLAEQTFAFLEVQRVNEDHLLHKTFQQLNWIKLLEIHKE